LSNTLGRALFILAALSVVAVVTALALWPQSSKTSTGLSSIGTRGKPVSFLLEPPAGLGRLGTPYVMAQLGGRAFFRVSRRGGDPPASSACYGMGKLAAGRLNVSLVDCTRFPTVNKPVLDEVGIEIKGHPRRMSIFAIEGFAADGVARLCFVDRAGRVVSRTAVAANVFRFRNVRGYAVTGTRLIAVDAHGREIWRHAL
jgi:hypothetical protein